MGTTSWSGSGSEGYVTSSGSGGLNPWIGWGISTLLLFFLNRKTDSSNTSSQQPSKFTEDNINCIGQPVPVVLGRCMVKNPLISYYGDFNAEPYLENYGMHSNLDAVAVLWPLLLNIIMMLMAPSHHNTGPKSMMLASTLVQAGPYSGNVVSGDVVGYVVDSQNGQKFGALVNAIIYLLITMLMNLFNNHLGRTTIQKGFLYYLGWQHIICWTGRNIGIKKLWMNVYDADVEASTEQGVWDNDGHIAWEKDNINGIEAYIDDIDMFGGYDEGGGFTGSVRFYFGNRQQPKDPWMVKSMNVSTIESELRGLTPQYPMYLTCVVSNREKTGGAYIGKQATIPEMWFEVVNYPSRIADNYKPQILQKFVNAINKEYEKPVAYVAAQDTSVQDYMRSAMNTLNTRINAYNTAANRYISNPSSNPFPPQSLLNSIKTACVNAYNTYPSTNREEFGRTLTTLEYLCDNGAWHLGRLDDDLNPAEAIYEILMNKYWGCGYVEDRIDVNSLINLGVVCEQEKLGVSCLINRTAQANDYVTKILNHINGVKYDDPKTGKLTFKLIRNDYDVDKIKSFNVSNTESCEFSRLDWSETTSAVEISFTDASNKYATGQFTFTDIANRLITGFYTSKSVEGDYFTTTANAKWLAQMNQLANGYPLSAINLVTNRYAYDVTIGDPIKVSWEPYGLNQVVYRVTDIDYANLTEGKISITGIEDVFGFDKLDFSTSESPQWTDPTDNPTSIGRYTFIEEPYETSRSLNTYMFAYAAQPTERDVYWDVWRNVNGNFLKSSQSMAWSTVGRLTYGYIKDFEIDSSGFEFSTLGQNGKELIEQKIEKIEKYPTTYTSTSGLNLLVIDNEWMSYETIEKLPNGHYQVKGVIRGIFDTLPEQHTAESIIYFIENRQNIAGTGNSIAVENDPPVTEYLELRTETRNVAQAFDPSLVEEHTTTRRSEQPSIMANMQFGTDMGTETIYQYDYTSSTIFSGDILFKFKGRNKYNNYGIISQVDTTTNITVAEDTMNVIQTHSQNINGEWKELAYNTLTTSNVEEGKLSWEQFCEVMGDNVQYQNTVILNVLTYNSTKDLYSYDKYEKSIDWRTPRFVGVVADQAEAQSLADSYILASANSIVVPATTVSPQIALLYTENPILIEGIRVTGTSSPNDIIGQDGNPYRLNTQAYRIVGKDANNKAILYPFTINEYYIFRTDFTQLVDNYDEYWQYNGTNWVKYLMV